MVINISFQINDQGNPKKTKQKKGTEKQIGLGKFKAEPCAMRNNHSSHP
jgi:hypothetical protein